jgi:hypothetical protein
MSLPALLSSAAAAWAAFYGAHQPVSVTVRWLHLAGLLVGGGTALYADRRILAADAAGRPAALTTLDASHRTVVAALAVVALSGALMTASDVDTFISSRLYWTKMGLVGALLLNGLALLRAEIVASRDSSGPGWTWLRATSGISLVLWLAILYMGLWLTVAA